MRRLARNLTIGRLAGSTLIVMFVGLRFWDPAPLENIRGIGALVNVDIGRCTDTLPNAAVTVVETRMGPARPIG